MILFPRCGRLTRQACPTGWPIPHAGQAGAATAGREVLDRIVAGTEVEHRRAELLEGLEVFTDARVERYWQLMGIMNGWTPFTPHVPAFEWMIAALRTRPRSPSPSSPAPYSYLPWLTIALIAAGVVYTLILSTVRPRVMEHAVATLEGEAEGASAAL